MTSALNIHPKPAAFRSDSTFDKWPKQKLRRACIATNAIGYPASLERVDIQVHDCLLNLSAGKNREISRDE
jgi:hypothetical protein